MAQKQITKRPQKTEEEQVQAYPEPVRSETTKLTDELLDEIDDILEQNAEDFVKGYVQRSGQ